MKTYQEFHDGHFEGFWIPNNGLIHIFLRTVGSMEYVFLLNGVVMLKATDFKEGNIILDVSFRNYEDIDFNDIKMLYDLDHDIPTDNWELKLLDKIESDKLIVLEINPSYGGSCLVLAKSMEVITRKEWINSILQSIGKNAETPSLT